MIAHGVVTAVSTDGRQAQAVRQPAGVPTGWLDVFAAPGIKPFLQVGDEVAIVATAGAWERAVILAWRMPNAFALA